MVYHIVFNTKHHFGLRRSLRCGLRLNDATKASNVELQNVAGFSKILFLQIFFKNNRGERKRGVMLRVMSSRRGLAGDWPSRYRLLADRLW